MTTLTEAPAAAPAEVTAETAETAEKLTRRAAVAAVEAAFAAFADQVVLARQLTLGTDRVRTQNLCNTGTKEFMAKGHLQPLHRTVHPAEETQDEARDAEQRIRNWVRTKMDGALEDYTATGLMKQVPKIEAEHKKWHEGFRKLIIDNFKSGYIYEPRMAEVLPQLGMEPYTPRWYASVTLSADWHAPLTNFGGSGLTTQQLNELLREKIVTALREIAGEGASSVGCNYGIERISRNIRVNTDTWRQ